MLETLTWPLGKSALKLLRCKGIARLNFAGHVRSDGEYVYGRRGSWPPRKSRCTGWTLNIASQLILSSKRCGFDPFYSEGAVKSKSLSGPSYTCKHVMHFLPVVDEGVGHVSRKDQELT
jgi:hypothetical protein